MTSLNFRARLMESLRATTFKADPKREQFVAQSCDNCSVTAASIFA